MCKGAGLKGSIWWGGKSEMRKASGGRRGYQSVSVWVRVGALVLPPPGPGSERLPKEGELFVAEPLWEPPIVRGQTGYSGTKGMGFGC